MSVVRLKYDKINEFGRREICYEADTTPTQPKTPEKKIKQTKLKGFV